MSAILSADDLNDFITPSVACIKPVESLPQPANLYEVENESIAAKLAPAQITLSDCLACSGCVTSAEAVLVQLQSHAEVLSALDAPGAEDKVFVASVSPQTRASLAAAMKVSQDDIWEFLENLLLRWGETGNPTKRAFDYIIDTNQFRQLALTYGAHELFASKQDPSFKLPLITSACPGYVCYLEKAHPEILSHLSKVKSPQAMAGTFIKSTLKSLHGVDPGKIYHVAIMPCFDKKLEAARTQLTDQSWSGPNDVQDPVRDVDCVLTTKEVIMLAEERGIDNVLSLMSRYNTSLSPAPRQRIFPQNLELDDFALRRSFNSNTDERSGGSGTSGGYVQHMLQTYQDLHPGSRIEVVPGRNADIIEYVVKQGDEMIIKMARCYGFRNIQNLVRKLKPPKTRVLPRFGKGAITTKRNVAATSSAKPAVDWAYVEVMACPGGCTNGGGQMKLEDSPEYKSKQLESSAEVDLVEQYKSRTAMDKWWLAQVDEAYFSAHNSDAGSDMDVDISQQEQTLLAKPEQVAEHWSRVTNTDLNKLIYTTFRAVESDVGKPKNEDSTSLVAEIAGKSGGGW